MLNEFFSHYADYEYLLASSQLFLAMLGMGALLAPKDFISEVRQPRSLCIGLGFQWMLVPMIALAVAALAPVPTGVAIGIMLIAAVPGGTLSNILTHFGRGNIALSISLTFITTVAALITTPLLLQLMMAEHLPDNFEMPTMDMIIGGGVSPVMGEAVKGDEELEEEKLEEAAGEEEEEEEECDIEL